MTQNHDAAARLWAEIEDVHEKFSFDKRRLGRLFFELRTLYSERNSGGKRLTSGHGTFQKEIEKRGFSPRRVREWVNDHEVATGLRPPAESEASKADRRWHHRAARAARGFDIPFRYADNPVSRFAALLPFEALRAAYCDALQTIHSDHGGDSEEAKRLIIAWKDVENLHKTSDTDAGQPVHSQEATVQ